MLKKSIIKKIVAVFLIYALTFSNFAFVTKSYASTIFDSVFYNKNAENVEFDAYFIAEKAKASSAISVACEKTVILYMNLNIQKEGYLKNAEIAFKESNKNSGLNFEIKNSFEESYILKSYENNTIKLKQINNSSEVYLEVPLEYVQEEYVSIDKFDKDFIVELRGTYVTGKGKEVEIVKPILLNLKWQDERKLELTSEIEKYIPYTENEENGLIVQTNVNLSSVNEKIGAVKSTELEITVPSIENSNLESVDVISKTREDFSKENWKLENNKIIINTENSLENEKYRSDQKLEKYIITYNYKKIEDEDFELVSNIKAKVITLGNPNIENGIESTFEYKAIEQLGSIVTYEIENKEESISKGNAYLKNEIDFNMKEIINISYADMVDEIDIIDEQGYYKTQNEEQKILNDIFYKSISIPKEKFESILGQDGEIDILTPEGVLIAKFTNSIPDEELKYEFEPYTVNSLILKTSKPINSGNLEINIKKNQKEVSYSKEEYSTFDKIIQLSKLKTKYKDIESLVESGKCEVIIQLENTITKPELELSTNTLSTLEPTELEMKIKLNNDEINSDIYGKSEFEIVLPEYIEEFEITDYSLLYGNNLEISSIDANYNDEGKIIIRITLDGLQQGLSPGILTNGTNIVIKSIVNTNQFTPLVEKDIEFKYKNSEATNYFDNGISNQKIIYSSPPRSSFSKYYKKL